MGPHPFIITLLLVDLTVGLYGLAVLVQLAVDMFTRWGAEDFFRYRIVWPKQDFRVFPGNSETIPFIDQQLTPDEKDQYWINLRYLITPRRFYILLTISILCLAVVGFFFGLGPVTYIHLVLHVPVIFIIWFFIWIFLLDVNDAKYKQMEKEAEIQKINERFDWRKKKFN